MAGATMMDLEVWIEDKDEPLPIRADQRDMAAFENRYDMGSAQGLERKTMVFLRYIAWAAMRRTGKTKDSYDDWDKNVVSVEPVEETEPPDPTTPAA